MILIACSKYGFILKIISYIFGILQIAAPIALILFTIFDLVKAFVSADEKAKSQATGKVVKRIIYVIILFLIPLLVKIIFKAIGNIGISGYGTENSPTNWIDCFNQYF